MTSFNLNHKELIKPQMIFKKCFNQNQKFHQWKNQGNWLEFHLSHYDWWAYPIDQNSSYGTTYTIDDYVKKELLKNDSFISIIKQNVQMVCQACGWDLYPQNQVQKTQQNQQWKNSPIKLYKIAKCMTIFGLKEQYQSVSKYARILIKKGYSFIYKGRNLQPIFGVQTYKQSNFHQQSKSLFTTKMEWESKQTSQKENKSPDTIESSDQLFERVQPKIKNGKPVNLPSELKQ